jgi:hypothetical protein
LINTQNLWMILVYRSESKHKTALGSASDAASRRLGLALRPSNQADIGPKRFRWAKSAADILATIQRFRGKQPEH